MTIQTKKTEIIVAVIGLLGILATAVFSNWDKMFPQQGVVQADYSGYRPTGNFETELRYLFEVSGQRQAIQEMQRQMAAIVDNDAVEGIVNYEQMLRIAVPIYAKHFTIEQIQELNKLYSTEIMQAMVKKTPLIIQELTAEQLRN